MGAITPLNQLARRIPIVAKARNGATKGRRPTSLDKWRFTTHSRPFAEAVAQRYGGEVKPFEVPSSPHKWEVFTEAAELSIVLLDDGYTIGYELWSAGGCQRRCDGINASVIQTSGPDDVEYVDTPCICDRKGALECSLKSRLTFVMPDLPFAGGVVYETSSKNFAEESQGMLALISQMQSRGINRGVLRLEQRKSSGNRKYTIAVVGVSESLEAIASGAAGMALAPAPDRPALATPTAEATPQEPDPAPPAPAATSSSPNPGRGAGEETSEGEVERSSSEGKGAGASTSSDEEVIEAEVVDAEIVLDKAERAKMRARFMATISGLNLSYENEVKPWLMKRYGSGWSDLSDGTVLTLCSYLFPDGTRAEKEDAQRRFKVAVEEFNEEAA